MQPTGTNIVLLMVDQWRADCFGSMDHPCRATIEEARS